jgi:hypothetical protein
VADLLNHERLNANVRHCSNEFLLNAVWWASACYRYGRERKQVIVVQGSMRPKAVVEILSPLEFRDKA